MKVIDQKNLPVKLPVFPTATAWLLLDRFQAPGWVQGCVYTLFGLIWLASIIAVWKQQPTNIFDR